MTRCQTTQPPDSNGSQPPIHVVAPFQPSSERPPFVRKAPDRRGNRPAYCLPGNATSPSASPPSPAALATRHDRSACRVPTMLALPANSSELKQRSIVTPGAPHPSLLPLKAPVTPSDHSIGPTDAPLLLVEYGDYQCPHCARAVESVDQARAKFGDRLRYVFRNFPLLKVHPLAKATAEAAEAVALLGDEPRFWEMHRSLFADQLHVAPDDLLKRARSLGIDEAKFSKMLAAHATFPRVQQDLAGGLRSGVTGTPTFFINGRRNTKGYDVASILAALEAELEGPPV